MYTERYVRRLKVAHNKLLDKFTLGSKYALKAQKKQLMARATRLVHESHEKLLDTFKVEALNLLAQTKKHKVIATEKTDISNRLIEANRSLEHDLALILRQNDYLEARIPEIQKKYQGYPRQEAGWFDEGEAEYKMMSDEHEKCVPPNDSGEQPIFQFKWEQLTIDERVDRACYKSHIICELEDMEPTFT